MITIIGTLKAKHLARVHKTSIAWDSNSLFRSSENYIHDARSGRYNPPANTLRMIDIYTQLFNSFPFFIFKELSLTIFSKRIINNK